MDPLTYRAAGVDIDAGDKAVSTRTARVWKVPPEFRTFNMGVGYVVVAPASAADEASAVLRSAGETVDALGEIVTGERGVELRS